jgi:hypothetical protein
MEKDTRVDRERNWSDLADHFKDKVNKRTSEVAFLQTKAGFLIAASVVLLQIITSLPKLESLLGIAAYALAIILAFMSVIISITSMNMGNSPTPLNPDKMILELTERPNMGRDEFSNWLAKSYAQANKDFNKVYNIKYRQQVIAAILLVVSFGLTVIIKGVSIYV